MHFHSTCTVNLRSSGHSSAKTFLSQILRAFLIYIFLVVTFFFSRSFFFFFFLNVHLCLLSEYLVMNRYLKLVLYGLVLVGSRNGFERDFIIKLKCQISPHVKYRQIQNPNQFNNSGHFSYCSKAYKKVQNFNSLT